MKAVLIAIAGLLVVSVRAQDCPTPSYTYDIVPKCLTNLKILLPSYANPTQYYDCSTGSPVLTSCVAPRSYFSYVLQECSTCANYIPAPDCSQIKLGLECKPIDPNSSTSTSPQTPTTSENPSTTTENTSESTTGTSENTSESTTETSENTSESTTGTSENTSESTTGTSENTSESTTGTSENTSEPTIETFDTTVYVPPPPSPNDPNVPAPPTPVPTVGTVATGPPIVE